MGKVRVCVPRQCVESKKEKRKKIPLALHKPGLGILKYSRLNHYREQALAKSVFLNSETLPTRMLWDSQLFEWGWEKKKTKKTPKKTEKATAHVIPQQWRELTERTLKSSQHQKKKIPLASNLKLANLSRSTLGGIIIPWLVITTQLATTGKKETGAKANSENIIIQRPA